MGTGTVVSIHIAPAAEAPTVSVPAVRAVPGRGLEGDRYFAKAGTYSERPGTGRQVTLIEWEAFEAVARDEGVRLDPGAVRRNVVTRGIALNDLVGREFSVGPVRLVGTRLCEPCAHMARLAGEPKALPAFVHRGGLRADILTEGTIRVGDPIREDA
jgi:MOSC domain-containing protein YiiM